MKKKYNDEPELQRYIVKHLNKQGYDFKKTVHDFDIVEPIRQIFIEVKLQDLAPAQLIYAIIKKNKQHCVDILGLANTNVIWFYKVPSIKEMEKFAKKIDPTLKMAPSNVPRKWDVKAFELLGKDKYIYSYNEKLDFKMFNLNELPLTRYNYDNFAGLYIKYKIDPIKYLNYMIKFSTKKQRVIVNDNGRILNTITGDFFYNKDLKETSLGFQIDPYNYRQIKNSQDIQLFEATYIADVPDILRYLDHIENNNKRKAKGRYFTKEKLSLEISNIIKEIDPDFIIEPYVGSGRLIHPIIEGYQGVANDILPRYPKSLKEFYEGLPWEFTNIDVVNTPTKELIKKWNIPKDKKVLILTNPPFGSSRGKSKDITYGGYEKLCGKGDLVKPAVWALIEIIKELRGGYLAFFCPAGIMYGRVGYFKVLGALLKDFEIKETHIFSGKNFDGSSSKMSIAFVVCRYDKNINTNIDSLEYIVDDDNNKKKHIKPKKMLLLKDGWKYNNFKYITGEIGVQHNDMFNSPPPKKFYTNVSKGGSELIIENVKIDLKILKVPSELIYGLWSTCVGKNSICNNPIYMNDAYVHLPDFSKQETLEILAYLVIHNLITELKLNYCKGKIGFVGIRRIFKFDGIRLTKGVKHLIDTYSNCKIGNKTIIEVFNELKREPNIENINKDYRKLIRKEIKTRLETIGYWDYIPIPKVLGRQKRKRYNNG